MLVQPPETDLLIPLPEAEDEWDPHMVHTHYFGCCVPEAQVGAYVYIRYQPAFPLSQGGVVIFRGKDNPTLLDALFVDYEITMPWPEVDGQTITTANGLRLEFCEPGRRALISYESADGAAQVRLEATAVTPLAARGHVMPSEELHKTQDSGGSEQFMHYTGEIVVRGEHFEVDCHYPRDRSWRQVRPERADANAHPPLTWTPVYFDEQFAFNQVGIEAPDSDPLWADAYKLPPDIPTHHFAWVARHGEVREVTRVHRTVTELHPALSTPLRMEIEAEDATGEVYHLTGEAIACSPLPAWPNLAGFDSVFRWEDGEGHVAHGPAQSIWSHRVQQIIKARRAAAAVR